MEGRWRIQQTSSPILTSFFIYVVLMYRYSIITSVTPFLCQMLCTFLCAFFSLLPLHLVSVATDIAVPGNHVFALALLHSCTII